MVNVVPEGFPEWRETMDTWGNLLLQAGKCATEMSAVGMGIP